MNRPVDRYRAFLEGLTPAELDHLASHVTNDVHFRDPFNDVTGVEAMARVFRHMYENVEDIRFTVNQAMEEGDVGLLQWRFQARLRGRPWQFDGASLLRFAPNGRVREHIDYWDSGVDFYGHLPLLGRAIAAIRRRLRVN